MTSVTIVRRIRARPAIVFEAMTTAEGIAQWWGPEVWPVLAAQSDPRPGGNYCVRFRTADGAEHESRGEFLEFVAPSRVVMSWRWTQGGDDPGVSRVEIALRAVPEGTELTFTHAQLHSEESAKSHESGWSRAFDQLERVLARAS